MGGLLVVEYSSCDFNETESALRDHFHSKTCPIIFVTVLYDLAVFFELIALERNVFAVQINRTVCNTVP